MSEPTITFEAQTPPGHFRRVLRVYADGEPIGFIVGRREKPRGPLWWDYWTDPSTFPMSEAARLVYGAKTRQIAVDNLLFAKAHPTPAKES